MISKEEILEKFPEAMARHDFKEKGSRECYRLLSQEVKMASYFVLWLDIMDNGLLVTITGTTRRQDSELVQSLDEVMAAWVAFQLTGKIE